MAYTWKLVSYWLRSRLLSTLNIVLSILLVYRQNMLQAETLWTLFLVFSCFIQTPNYNDCTEKNYIKAETILWKDQPSPMMSIITITITIFVYSAGLLAALWLQCELTFNTVWCSEVVLAHNPSGIPIKKLNGEALIGGYERNKVHKDWG